MRTLIFALCFFISLASDAGQTCEVKPLQLGTLDKAMRLATKTRQILEDSGAKVALIGRAGSDLSAYGLTYSHMAVLLRDHPKGRWLLVHMLNDCGTDHSNLYDEGLGNFFLDDLYRFQAVVVFPSPNLQNKLAEVFTGPLARQLYSPHYSMIAYPFATTYQNSNQWVLELLAVALAPDGAISMRQQAQQWLQNHAYQPSRLKISAFKRLGASLFAANTRFDDHLDSEASEGYQAVTVESVIQFLHVQDRGMKEQVLRIN